MMPFAFYYINPYKSEKYLTKMKPAKAVIANERDVQRGLEKFDEYHCRLSEMSGEIYFSETVPTGYGSCLILKVQGHDEELRWNNQAKMPIHAEVGRRIRVFFERAGREIYVNAYELQNLDGEVLTRGRGGKCSFVESD